MGLGSGASAQSFCADTLCVEVFFHKSSTAIDSAYRENHRRLAQFEQQWQAAGQLGATVTLRAGASPEGRSYANDRIARARARSVDAWLREHLGAQEIRSEIVGNDWAGLEARVQGLSKPWKADALSILADHTMPSDTLQSRLMELEDGAVWKWLDQCIFPDLRVAVVTVVLAPKDGQVVRMDEEAETEAAPAPAPANDSATNAAADKAAETAENAETEVPAEASETVKGTHSAEASEVAPAAKRSFFQQYERKPRLCRKDEDAASYYWPFALRSNLLLPLLNIGIEVPIGNQWSVGANWYYPWLFRNSDHKNCTQALMLELDGRYWLGGPRQSMDARMTGHSVGVFSQAGYYDLERRWKGHQGEFITLGVDYLYAWRFRNNWRLECSLGIGYFYSQARQYEVYTPGGKGYKERDMVRVFKYFGPVKGTVSLVVPVYFREKGGEK